MTQTHSRQTLAKQCQKIRWRRSFKYQRLVRSRLGDTQPQGVEAHLRTSRSVSLVAYHRMPQPRQVSPYLMLAAGFQLPATGSIAGVVTDSGSANPIQGASVSADSGQTGFTDAAGAYSLPNVPTRSRTVSFSAAGYEPASQATSVTENATSPLNMSLTPVPVGGGTGTLKGTVSNATGSKIGGALVQVTGGPGGSTNKGGKYSIQNVPEGLQTVITSHPDYADTTSVEVTITAGATVTLNITSTRKLINRDKPGRRRVSASIAAHL